MNICLRGIALQSLSYIVNNGVIITNKLLSNIDKTDKQIFAVTKIDKPVNNVSETSKDGEIVI